jgi:hypothetical protein
VVCQVLREVSGSVADFVLAEAQAGIIGAVSDEDIEVDWTAVGEFDLEEALADGLLATSKAAVPALGRSLD